MSDVGGVFLSLANILYHLRKIVSICSLIDFFFFLSNLNLIAKVTLDLK